MEIHLVLCPDRDHDVRVAWVHVPDDERDESRPGPWELICLEADGCTGLTCHLFSMATCRMKDHLRAAGWSGDGPS